MSSSDEQGRNNAESATDAAAVHLQAQASGDARVNQAGRDLHVHYGDGLRRRRRTDPGAAVRDECPYPGLAAFEQAQARWFFGRDALVAELIGRLDHRLQAGGLQVVVAPSGAGKSSLARAGLLRRLEQGALPGSSRWPVMVLTPTAHPMRAVAAQIAALTGSGAAGTVDTTDADGPVDPDSQSDPSRWTAALRGQNPSAPVVMVVDQFEELFTLCADERERRRFIDLLTHVADPGESSAPAGLVVIGLRADFYAACLDHPALRRALQDGPLVVGTMSEAELREAIVYPAQDVALEIEPGLVELLLRDLGVTIGGDENAAAGYEVGRLPLLAHALRASWQQRDGATLTVAGYRTTGGIQRAIATTADRVYTNLNDAGQETARALFLRLVKIGEGTSDIRRRVTRAELAGIGTDPDTAGRVVDAFARARLLTRHQDTIEITHEALLHGWPQLRRWLDEDRAGRMTHQDLEEAASAWTRGDHDSSLLYRGNRLETARAWATATAHRDLSPAARAFLTAAIRHQRRMARLRTGTVAVLTVLVVVASVTAAFAFQQQHEAVRQRDLAVYGRVLAEADRLSHTDVSLSAQLDLVADRMRPGDETHARLIAAENTPLSQPLTGHTRSVDAVAFSRDGRMLASAGSDQTIRLWNVGDAVRPRALGGPLRAGGGPVETVAFSPGGRVLAGAGDDGLIRLWDVTSPARPRLLGRPLSGHTGTVYSIAFSPDGQILASASGDRTVRLWNVSHPAHATAIGGTLGGQFSAERSVAFSPDGHMLAGANQDGTVWLWNVTDPAFPALVDQRLTGHTGAVLAVAFGRDGHTLASAGSDRIVRLWDLPRTRLIGHDGPVHTAVFSPDGRVLASAGEDREVRLWNLSDPTRPAPLARPLTGFGGIVGALAFSPDGHTLAGGSADRTIRLWDLTSPARPKPLGRPFAGNAGIVAFVAFSADGHTLAATGQDGRIRLWNVTDRARPIPLGATPVTDGTPALTSLAFNPRSSVLASAGSDRVVRLWDVSDPARPASLARPLTAHATTITSVTFSPDGHTLASGSTDRTIRLWNVKDPAHPVPLGEPLTGHTAAVHAVAFSPDGHILASAAEDGTVRLWNVSDPARATALGPPLSGHNDVVLSVAFGSRGPTMASAGDDAAILLWRMSPGDAVRRICAATGNTLTRDEWHALIGDRPAYHPPCA